MVWVAMGVGIIIGAALGLFVSGLCHDAGCAACRRMWSVEGEPEWRKG